METKNNNLFESIVDDTFDFKKEVSRYFSYWPIFLVSMFVTFVVAYSYLRLAPRVYSSTAKIKILDKSDGLELPTAGFVFNRSNINLENEIEILLCESRNVDARVSFDGQANINLQAGDRIVIRQHENKLLLIHPEDYDYYHILRSKLGWSATPP